MTISLACPDWWQKLQRGETPIADLPLDAVEATAAVDLFNKLRVPDIPGQPTFGEVGAEWIRDIVRNVFGAVDPVSGARLVRELFNLVPKKNSKTTHAAALGLVAMMMNRRPNIDGMIVGPTQEVAEKCFSQAAAMIAADPYLTRRFRVIDHRQLIVDQHVDEETGIRMNARLKIKSFDPKIVTGSIPAFAIIDELHLMSEMHQAERVIGQIRGGMITNPDSLLIIISTQSEIVPQGVFKAELDYARKVRDGQITRSVRMLPVLYEFPEHMQLAEDKPWRDPATWAAVLPNIGRPFSLEGLVELHRAECDKGPQYETRWVSQHLNIQIGMGHGGDGWIGSEFWPGAAEPGLTLDGIIERSEVIVVGIDGGGMDDMLGLTLVGRDADTRQWLTWSRAWIHPVVLERRKSIAPLLLDFERMGDLVICRRPTQDIEDIAALCARLNAGGLLPAKHAVGLDPASSINAVVDAIEEAGLSTEQLVPVTQGYKLTGAIKGTERRLFDGTLKHAAQPIMQWCVDNAKCEAKGNAVVVTKAVSGAGKIDALMALYNAVTLMSWNPVAARGGITPWDRDPAYRMVG